MRRASVLLVMLAGCLPVRAAGVVWLEAERFETPGGWVRDAQFVDQMGSPYLLAVGLGEPVKDATTTFTAPRPGKYRLWARTKDWAPKHHPGRFRILIDGKAADRVFGQGGKTPWRWEDGGVVDLKGETTLALHDLTGYYGRCDAIVMSGDLEWTPPDEPKALAAARIEHGGVSAAVKEMPAHDVVVVGGGLAGCTAAAAAARNGASVALIQNRPVLGGNASPEILVPPVGVWPWMKRHPLAVGETGIIEEYRTPGRQRVGEGKLYAKRLERFVRLEPNLDLHLNTHGTGVEMARGSTGRIAAVLAMDVRTGQRMRFAGKLFIDCTGDAVIGADAGATYRTGKEPKAMHNEPWAPEKASKHTMGNGLKYYHGPTGKPQPFKAPPWVYTFPTCKSFSPGRHPNFITSDEIQGQWKLELGGTRDTIADAEEIRDDLLRLIYGLWDHMKNRCPPNSRRAADHKLLWVGHVTGKRENRRLLGDHVLTQNDIGKQVLFPDRVALGGWSVDDHYSAGFFHKGPTGMHHDRKEHHYKGVLFSIPFRCLYSKNIENLMMAGRDVSASHLGMSNIRVMLTCAVMGHAAGTGAGMCISLSTTPRELCRGHIADLQQQLLKEGAHIVRLAGSDRRDLARRAKVSASSEGDAGGQPAPAANVIDGVARFEDGKAHAWVPKADADGPHWVQLAWDMPAEFNVVHVSFQTVALSPKRFTVEAHVDGAWKQVAEVADNRHRRHVLGLDRISASKLRIVLAEARGVCEIRVYDEPKRLVDIALRAHRNMRLADQGPWLPWPTVQRGRKPAPATRRKLKLPGIVLDASAAQKVGHWTASTWGQPYVGDGYLHDGNTGKGDKSIRFALGTAKPGPYEVRLAYVPHTNRASNTLVTVHHAGGTKHVRIDQRARPTIDGVLVSLGTFTLDAKSALVISNTGTDGYVIVDAVQLVPVK